MLCHRFIVLQTYIGTKICHFPLKIRKFLHKRLRVFDWLQYSISAENMQILLTRKLSRTADGMDAWHILFPHFKTKAHRPRIAAEPMGFSDIYKIVVQTHGLFTCEMLSRYMPKRNSRKQDPRNPRKGK